MKKSFLLILVLLLINNIYADDPDFRYINKPSLIVSGDDVNKKPGHFRDTTLYIDQNSLYIASIDRFLSKSNLAQPIFKYLVKYDQNGEVIYSQKFELKTKNDTLVNIYITPNALIYLFKEVDKKLNKVTFYVDIKDNSDHGNLQKIELYSTYINKEIRLSSYGIQSDDLNNVAILIEETATSEMGQNKKFVIASFDKNGSMTWKKNYELPNNSNYLSNILKLNINKNGEILVIEKKYSADNPQKKDFSISNSSYVKGYQNNAYIISNNGENIIKKSLDNHSFSGFLINTSINPSNQNFQIVAACGQLHKKYTDGYSYHEIEPNGNIKAESFNSFPEQFVSSAYPKIVKTIDGKSKFTEEFVKINLAPRTDDSGVYIVFEPIGYVLNAETAYIDILAVSIDNKGKNVWNYRIPRFKIYDYAFNITHHTLLTFSMDNKLNILYNEQIVNLEKSLDEKFRILDGTYDSYKSIIRIIDKEGQLTTQPYIFEKDKSLRIMGYAPNYIFNHQLKFSADHDELYGRKWSIIIAPLK